MCRSANLVAQNHTNLRWKIGDINPFTQSKPAIRVRAAQRGANPGNTGAGAGRLRRSFPIPCPSTPTIRASVRCGWAAGRIRLSSRYSRMKRASGFCANYGGGAFACSIIDQHLKRFLIGLLTPSQHRADLGSNESVPCCLTDSEE